MSAGASLPLPEAPPALGGPGFRAGAGGEYGGPGGGSGWWRLWVCARDWARVWS